MTPQRTYLQPRELASRVANGLSILLLWHPVEDAVSVSVADSDTGEFFEIPVERHRAMEAFHHPFGYAV
jgi:hypothetical protein